MIKPVFYLSTVLSTILIVCNFFSVNCINEDVSLQPATNYQTDTLRLDVQNSELRWKGTKLSGKHEGTIRFQEGMIVVKNNKIIAGNCKVDMNSIGITDIPLHEVEARKNLTKHLKSKDFFYSEKYPVSSFEISRTHHFLHDSLEILGNLSIRNVSKKILITAKKFLLKENELKFKTFFVIDRFEWNVAYQGSFWKRITSILDNNLVHAEIELFATLVFRRDLEQ